LKIKKRRKSIQMIYSKSAELAGYSKSADLAGINGDGDDADDGKVEFKPFNSDKLLAVKPYKLEVTKPDKTEKPKAIKKGHQFTTSYLVNTVEDEMQLKHIQEIEGIKVEYNKLVNDMKDQQNELQIKLKETQNQLERTEKSKLELLKNFGEEMDRMRNEIKKQNFYIA